MREPCCLTQPFHLSKAIGRFCSDFQLLNSDCLLMRAFAAECYSIQSTRVKFETVLEEMIWSAIFPRS